MNIAHWHLLLNHLPVIGSIIGTLILTAGFILKNTTVKQTALGVFIFSALFAIPSYLTGEGAEETVENIPGISKAFIESHEDLGKTFLILMSTLGVLSLLTLIAEWRKKRTRSGLYMLVFIASIITGVMSKQLGTSGGQIRHTEISKGSQLQDNSSGKENTKESNHEADRD